MTDITESDIKIKYLPQHKARIIINSFPTDPIDEEQETPNAKNLIQQILQNQKDAQEVKLLRDARTQAEYKIIELHKVIDSKDDSIRLRDEKIENLQSQHKKLVDAIQTRIEECDPINWLVKNPNADLSKKNQDLIHLVRNELQNLLKESEK